MSPFALLKARCLSYDAWENAVLGRSGFLILNRAVPPLVPFRVYFGKRLFPDMVDGKHAFRATKCERLGFRKYRVWVKVAPVI